MMSEYEAPSIYCLLDVLNKYFNLETKYVKHAFGGKFDYLMFQSKDFNVDIMADIFKAYHGELNWICFKRTSPENSYVVCPTLLLDLGLHKHKTRRIDHFFTKAGIQYVNDLVREDMPQLIQYIDSRLESIKPIKER